MGGRRYCLDCVVEHHSVNRLEECEEILGSGGATWRLARKALGEKAFGFNVVEIAPGGQIPEHDEGDSGQHELYGDLPGRRRGLPGAGLNFPSIEPAPKRTILNRSDAPATALLIGVDPSGGYEPMSWA